MMGGDLGNMKDTQDIFEEQEIAKVRNSKITKTLTNIKEKTTMKIVMKMIMYLAILLLI